MNERLRELFEQAHSRKPTMVIDHQTGQAVQATFRGEKMYRNEFDPEKFAELIVRECAELSVNSQYANTRSEYYEGFNEALVYVGNKIKQHFGVEE